MIGRLNTLENVTMDHAPHVQTNKQGKDDSGTRSGNGRIEGPSHRLQGVDSRLPNAVTANGSTSQ